MDWGTAIQECSSPATLAVETKVTVSMRGWCEDLTFGPGGGGDNAPTGRLLLEDLGLLGIVPMKQFPSFAA